MKKLISALIAIAMIMSIGLPALATDPTPVTTPAPTDNGHTQVIADADPDYMIVIPRTVNFGELNRSQPRIMSSGSGLRTPLWMTERLSL